MELLHCLNPWIRDCDSVAFHENGYCGHNGCLGFSMWQGFERWRWDCMPFNPSVSLPIHEKPVKMVTNND